MLGRFLARRLAMLVASLLVASFIIFAAVYAAPGNPISALSGGRALPASAVAILEQRYHLNEPFFVQYWYWLSNALHGNLGISITLRENVSSLIASRIWTTAGLVAYASVLIVIFGIGLGILSGLRRGIADTGTLVVTASSAGSPRSATAPASCPTCGTSPCPPWRSRSPRWRSWQGSPGPRSARSRNASTCRPRSAGASRPASSSAATCCATPPSRSRPSRGSRSPR